MRIKKYIPNILTTLRLILVPFFILFFIKKSYLVALILFIIAAVTDFIDGYLARKWNVVSKYGKIVDPIADKSLMISALLLCCYYSNYLTIILVLLEGSIAITNIIYFKKSMVFKVLVIGKVKTVFLMTTISFLQFNRIINFNSILEIILIILTIILQISVLITYYINYKKNKK